MAAAECNYREIDRQLKEQFIHGLNNKVMLDEMIREPTVKSNNEQTTSEGILAWAKRVEVQWAQAAISNDITELCQFNKIKMAQKSKDGQMRQTTSMTGQQCLSRYCSGIHVPQQCPAYGKMCAGCWKTGHFRKVCWSKKDHVVHELEVKGAQEAQEGEIEKVSIDLVHLNRNWSLIMAHLEMQAGENIIEIPYNTDTVVRAISCHYIYSKNCLKIQQKISFKIHKKSHKASNIQPNKYNAIRHMCGNN